MTTDKELFDSWATEAKGPIALHLKQKLLPVEGENGIIFPPTYADIGYNIDLLSDGTRVATIDSVGSQANRLEPMFKPAPGAQRDNWLVPPIEIVLRTEVCGECDGCKKKQDCKYPRKEKRSILDLAHRAADAVVQSSPTLRPLVAQAFQALHQNGDAGPLCQLVPTSLVFGVWDSRGGSGEKRPRLVRSIIRAWDVEPLHAAAQFNSVWKALDEAQRSDLKAEAKKKDRVDLSVAGLNDAPSTFRKVARGVPQIRDGIPNPDARVLGGVIAKGRIEREVTVNLVALRGLRGKEDTETKNICKYLLGLALLAATADIDLFLREGCHLRYAGQDEWYEIPRRGEPRLVNFASDLIRDYVAEAANHFRTKWPKDEGLEHVFDLTEAKKLLAKKTEEEQPEAE